MNHLRIGIIPYRKDGAPHVQLIGSGYLEAVRRLNGHPVFINHFTPAIHMNLLLDSLDGIIFAGGPDIDPALYNREIEPNIGTIAPERDALELELFDRVVERRMPMLGICRGIQLINVAMGGTLVQHIPDHFKRDHQQKEKGEPFCHSVEIAKDSQLFELVKESTIPVNSFHHQCIDDLAPKLVATAYADEGMIEAVECPDYPFMMAVQWHPERTIDDDACSIELFRAFMQACAQTPPAEKRPETSYK